MAADGAHLSVERRALRPVDWRMLLAIALGTILNPLNSSMVAVALVDIHTDFRTDIGTSTWMVSAFYLTGAVAQPLMGRLADLLGARRVFLTGVSVAAVGCAVAPLSHPCDGWSQLVPSRPSQPRPRSRPVSDCFARQAASASRPARSRFS